MLKPVKKASNRMYFGKKRLTTVAFNAKFYKKIYIENKYIYLKTNQKGGMCMIVGK